jgi:hypothetical protein
MLSSDTLHDVSQARNAAQSLLDAFELYRPEHPGRLTDPLSDYAAIVAAVNQRLRAAQVLLAQGRREESIHACDAEPNLLDCVAELDSCDQAVEAWLPTIEELGLTRPQRLLSEAAEELGTAYDLRHQLEGLMRKHRLLAISRAPIEQRVAVLRRISQMDSGNPRWLEDLKDYENACKKSLQDELDDLAKIPPEKITAAAAERIKKVVAQLCDSSWLDPLDGSAVRAAQAVLQRIAKARARAEIADVASLIALAYDHKELSRCRDLIERIDNLQSLATLDDANPHAATVRQCRDWVIDADNAESLRGDADLAADDVRQVLREGCPFISPWAARAQRASLQDAVQRLASVSTAIGDDDNESLLESGYAHIRRLDAVPIRFWAIALVASAGLLSSLGAGGWWWWLRSYEQRVIGVLKDELIDGAISEKDLPAAIQKWGELCADHSWLREHSIATVVNEKIETLVRDADLARRDAEGNLHAASERVDRVIPGQLVGLEQQRDATPVPNDAMVDTRENTRKEISLAKQKTTAAQEDIEAYKSLVGTAQSRELERQLDELRTRLRSSERRLEDLITDIGERAAKHIDLKIKRLEDMPGRQLGDHRDEIASLEQQATALKQFATAPAKPLADRLVALQDSLRQHSDREKIQDTLTRAARQGSVNAFYSAIEAELRSSPDPTVADDLRKVLSERRCTDSAMAWSVASSSWVGNLSCKPAEGKKWLEAIERAQKTSPSPDFSAEEKSRLDDLTSVLEQRRSRPVARIDLMEEEMEQPILQDDVLAVRGDKGTYYTRQPENLKGWYFRDSSLLTKFNVVVKEQANKGEVAKTAPHVALAADIRKQLKAARVGDIDFDIALMNVFNRFVDPQKDKGADAVIRCLLLKMILDELKDRKVCEGNEDLEAVLDDIENNIDIDTPWIDPEGPDPGDRKPAQKLLGDVATLKRIQTSYDERAKAIATRPWPVSDLVFAGWAEQTGDKVVLHRTDASTDGRLVIAVPSNASSFEFLEFGRVRNGEIFLEPGVRPAFGQPVFCVPRNRNPDTKPRKLAP